MRARKGLGDTLKKSTKRQKRSQIATLMMMGATPIFVLGWDPAHTEYHFFNDIESCQKKLPQSYCNALNKEVKKRHTSMAPKYDSLYQCEADFAYITEPACKNNWCDSSVISTCEATEKGTFSPHYNGFMVTTAVITSIASQRPSPATLSEQDLQPVYRMPEGSLVGDDDSFSNGLSSTNYYSWHAVSPGGSYLGNQRYTKPVKINKFQLASGTEKAYQGQVRRGGFGGTARRTMISVRA
ncbi:DUF1190 domain-containing protein [Oceanimonas smirnovii]|uniref:DUF1190 domain-containing protein n=1 Tax=Oceanimonas smirnovii TaxID=264574 RepID=UPI000A052AA8|nr:DUF1190 domain-containing protein [Oceanimonas smirnovii]